MIDLSVREYEVLDAAARGKGVRETGRDLYLSPDTVKSHRRRVLQRLGARNMTEAVALAVAAGLLSNPPGSPAPASDLETGRTVA